MQNSDPRRHRHRIVSRPDGDRLGRPRHTAGGPALFCIGTLPARSGPNPWSTAPSGLISRHRRSVRKRTVKSKPRHSSAAGAKDTSSSCGWGTNVRLSWWWPRPSRWRGR